MKKQIVLFCALLLPIITWGQETKKYLPNKMVLMNLVSNHQQETQVPYGTIYITQKGGRFSFVMGDNKNDYLCNKTEHNTFESYDFHEGIEVGTNNKVQIRIDKDQYFTMITLYFMGDSNALVYFTLNQDTSTF